MFKQDITCYIITPLDKRICYKFNMLLLKEHREPQNITEQIME